MSPRILDNLGIIFNAEKVYSDYAATLGISADRLSDFGKKQALLNVVMEKGKVVETAAAADIFRSPQHPYTRKLMQATPRIGTAPALSIPLI